MRCFGSLIVNVFEDYCNQKFKPDFSNEDDLAPNEKIIRNSDLFLFDKKIKDDKIPKWESDVTNLI
jgi:hypothetical protein